jgi:hypothetical protein
MFLFENPGSPTAIDDLSQAENSKLPDDFASAYMSFVIMPKRSRPEFIFIVCVPAGGIPVENLSSLNRTNLLSARK